MLMNLTEAHPLIRTELAMKNPNGGQQIRGLVDCVATLHFVSDEFVQHFSFPTRKLKVKTHVRFTDGQRVTFSTVVCEISFELARHEFRWTSFVLHDLRDLVLGLPWLNVELALLHFRNTRVFTLMDGTSIETQTQERRH
jgi:hypothetical protein